MKKRTRFYFGTNQKMYKTASESSAYLDELIRLTFDLADSVTLFVIPSYTALPDAVRIARGGHIMLGAQNISDTDDCAQTGEISPRILCDLGGVDIAEIGHSERRAMFGETPAMTARKVRLALDYGMTALLCIGETAEERDYGVASEVLAIQLKIGLSAVAPEELSRVLVAYEPVWSIGNHGVCATEDCVAQRAGCIRSVLKELFPSDWAEIPVLYGGSVAKENAADLLSETDMDGLFVGRSALDACNFNLLIRNALSACRDRG